MLGDDWAAAFKATGWNPESGTAGGTSTRFEIPSPSTPSPSPSSSATSSGIGDDWAAAFKATGWNPVASPTPAGPAQASSPPPRAASTGGGASGAGEVEAYIRRAAAQRGIDPDVAIRVAQSEGGLVPNRTGSFSTGKSFWPFQLHYGGAGYEQFGNVAGMGNTFTARTGWQPGDPEAWRAATDYALDQAKQSGWGQWYGARNQGITGFQGISRGAASGVAPVPNAPTAPGGRGVGPVPNAPAGGNAGVSTDDWTAPFRKLGWSPDGATSSTRAPASSGGSTSTTGAPGTAPVTATSEKQALAASWALSQMGSQAFYNLCQRFIEQAYGTGGQFGSAAAAGKALFKTANPAEADVGDLVFFRPDASNGYAGHAAIYLGNGEMVGATNAGVTRDRIDSPYWSKLLVGFGDPPNQWSGRASTAELARGAQQLAQTGQRAAGAAGSAVRGVVSAVGGLDLGDWASAFRRTGWNPGA